MMNVLPVTLTDDRVRLETDLRQAISAQQFHLVFQPLINAKSQKLVGFEALIRWNHPQRGFVPPAVSMWAANVVFALVGAALAARMGRESGSSRGGGLGELLYTLRSRLTQRRSATA